jgi:Na+/melibiose symporter-like transporter
MKLLRKLGNPMALVVQGFALGAALFFATHPGAGETVAGIAFAQAPAAATGTLSF